MKLVKMTGWVKKLSIISGTDWEAIEHLDSLGQSQTVLAITEVLFQDSILIPFTQTVLSSYFGNK